MAQIQLHVVVEKIIDGTVTASHSTQCAVSKNFDALKILAAARAAIEGVTPPAGSPPAGPSRDDPSFLQVHVPHQQPKASRPSAVFDHGCKVLFEKIAGQGDLWDGFTDLPVDQVVANHQVQRATQRLATSGCVDAFRLVLRHGPARCIQVHAWALKIQQKEGTKSLSGLISAVLERGEPRGAVRKLA